MEKFTVLLGYVIGTIIGTGIPLLWGNDSYASPTFAFFGIIGGILGAFITFQIIEHFKQ